MDEIPCNPHPNAPHGFNRDASHSEGRYVCDCEFFNPEDYHKNFDGNLILNEEGKPIPSTTCLCHAFEPFECCCGAWDDVDIDEWYRED